MADASQQPSDRRLAVEAQRGEGASRFPFLLTDDLRSPLDDLQRLRDAEVKTRDSRSSTRISISRSTATPSIIWSRA